MRVWNVLEALFRESKQYRGDNEVKFADLEKLIHAISEKGKVFDGAELDPKGGVIECEYQFDPSIWGKWYDKQDVALTMASSDKDVVSQYAGRSQGSMTFKTNWGGRVVNMPGKARGDFERLPSAMDRYDVLMQGEVADHAKTNRRTGQVTSTKVGRLMRVAYSPGIGSTEERKARLVALISGQAPPALSRRPQPKNPELSKKQADVMNLGVPDPAPRPKQGQNVPFVPDDDDGEERPRSSGGQAPSDFKQRMAKHNAVYQPSARRKRDDEDDVDYDAMLFPKKK